MHRNYRVTNECQNLLINSGPIICAASFKYMYSPSAHNTIRQAYFERMSDTIAYLCGGKVAIMDRNIRRGRTGKVKQASIWNQVEFVRLRMSGADKWTNASGRNRIITRVDAIEENNPAVPETLIWWKGWWYQGRLDWPNVFTKPFKKRDVEDYNTEDATLSHSKVFEAQDIGSTALFDEGGALEVNYLVTSIGIISKSSIP
jgi:hypothetical protein